MHPTVNLVPDLVVTDDDEVPDVYDFKRRPIIRLVDQVTSPAWRLPWR